MQSGPKCTASPAAAPPAALACPCPNDLTKPCLPPATQPVAAAAPVAAATPAAVAAAVAAPPAPAPAPMQVHQTGEGDSHALPVTPLAPACVDGASGCATQNLPVVPLNKPVPLNLPAPSPIAMSAMPVDEIKMPWPLNGLCTSGNCGKKK